jgi:hypothetical protein
MNVNKLSIRQLLQIANLSYETDDNCIDVRFITNGEYDGYLEILKKEHYNMFNKGKKIQTISLIDHIFAEITEKDFINKTSIIDFQIGRSFIFDKTYRLYIELMAP